MNIRLPLATLALSIAGGAVLAQYEYDERLLQLKTRFAEAEIRALAEPFAGVRRSDGIETGLFPLQRTGASAEPVVRAARDFLDSLSPAQTMRTFFAVDDPEWRRWSNVDNAIYVRHGVSLEEMTANQKAAAMSLVGSGMSARGLSLVRDIMKTEQTLRELNDGDMMYGEEKYYVTVMGEPSAAEPWGWQLDGHHLVVNYFVLGDQVVATPMFLGGEPAVATSGTYAGNAILQVEQDLGLELAQSLNEEQFDAATIAGAKGPLDIKAEANQDNLVLDFEGISASALDVAQNARLLDLIERYVGNIRDAHAAVKMDEVRRHIDDTHFVWIGERDDDAVFYYRIHSPVILIEFDHQRPVGNPAPPRGVPTRQHVHVVVRTPNGNDYGKDLLRQHLLSHPH